MRIIYMFEMGVDIILTSDSLLDFDESSINSTDLERL